MSSEIESVQKERGGSKPSEWLEDVTLNAIPLEGQQLLETYSGIKHDEVLQHVLAIREKGWATAPFTCVGHIRFLGNRFRTVPYYEAFKSRLQSGATFLDVGCGFGQELRYLIVDENIPPSQLYGFDLLPEFIDLGYDLFRDRDRLQLSIFAADLLSASANPELERIEGRMDLVQVNQVLHVFDWDNMLEACKRMVTFTTPQAGSMIAGTQMGSRNAGSYLMPGRVAASTGRNYRHNPESMERFWSIVGDMTGTKWKVDCAEINAGPAVQKNKLPPWAEADPGLCMIYFCATRL